MQHERHTVGRLLDLGPVSYTHLSPIVYSETGHYIDNTLAMAGERAEGLVLADFDLEAIRAWRARRVWGGAYRKTYAYPSLLEARPPKPLVRRDNRTQCP